MLRRKGGPTGQVVIPKQMRDALGLKLGVEVVQVRGKEVVISKPKIEGNYTEYYTSTQSSKLKKLLAVKEIIDSRVKPIVSDDEDFDQVKEIKETRSNEANSHD